MQIYLARPGADREGPFSLQDILQDLQAGKYGENDFWAWYEGLPQWMPLHQLLRSPEIMECPASPPAQSPDAVRSEQFTAPANEVAAVSNFWAASTFEPCSLEHPEQRNELTEVSENRVVALFPGPSEGRIQEEGAVPFQHDAEGGQHSIEPFSNDFQSEAFEPSVSTPLGVTSSYVAESGESASAALLSQASPELQLQPAESNEVQEEAGQAAAVSDERLPAGMPFRALERAFVFTTGDGPSVWESPLAAFMLKQIIGEELPTIRRVVPRDVIFGCNAVDLLNDAGGISESVWRTMSSRQPVLLELAKQKLYHLCIRIFRIEGDHIVALILFYNKQKIQDPVVTS